VDVWQRWKGRVIVESVAPLAERLKQCRQLDLPKAPRRLSKIPHGPFQHRPHTNPVSCGVVVKGYGNLHQPLKKLFVFGRYSAPDIFERFVGVEKLGVVE
jgi:hypothetical protein